MNKEAKKNYALFLVFFVIFLVFSVWFFIGWLSENLVKQIVLGIIACFFGVLTKIFLDKFWKLRKKK